MEGGALFNPGFIGGSFNWWIGRIADNSSWRDNELSGKFENPNAIPGFGKRYKVRIMGVHDASEDVLPSDQLPWANLMYPVTAGGGQGGSFQSANLRQGMFVFGFYMDGQDMQVPVIMGVLGNNAQTELETKIGEGDTNFDPTSGFAQGQEDIKGPAKSLPKDEDKGISKPKDTNTSKEEADLAGETNSQGLPLDKLPTKEQQADLESAKASIGAMADEVKTKFFGTTDPSSTQVNDYIKEKVTLGMKKRVDFANSPGSPSKKGALIESIGSLMQVAASDIILEDKYQEKTVLMIPDDPVGSAVKAIQTISDNLTKKIEKNLSSMGSYADAVSSPPQDLNGLVKDSACGMAKYMKVITDKMMEYTNKTLNEELTETIAEMPMCMRSEMGDMMNMMGEKSLQKYNGISDKVCGMLEGILSNALNLDELKQKTEEGINKGFQTEEVDVVDKITGKVVTKTVEVPVPSTHPKVPMCAAEDIVASAIVSVKDDITKVNSRNLDGINRFVSDISSQLERLDKDFLEKVGDESTDGAVTEITDEEVLDEVRGGTLYKTTIKVGTQYLKSTDPARAGITTATSDGQGLTVDITVPTGGLGGYGGASAIDFTWISQGTGYINANGVTCNGGSGTGMKVNFQASSGSITNLFVHTTGTGYKAGEELTIQSGNFDAKFTLDAVWGKIEDGGIKINKRGNGYVVGDVYFVLGGSDDATFAILSVNDPGDGKADAAEGSKPQSLGSMLSKLSSISGNMTSALNFKNITSNVFPFELPANPAINDYVTLGDGGAGQADSQIPSFDSIRKSITDKADSFIPEKDSIPFLTPTVKKVIDLTKKNSE